MVIDIPADRKIGKISIEEVRVRLAHSFGNVLSFSCWLQCFAVIVRMIV
jgi:hypothetical protein